MKQGQYIDEAVPADYLDTKTHAPKYAVKVKVKGLWGHMARRTKAGKDLGILFFKTAAERDCYMLLLLASHGPKIREARKRVRQMVERGGDEMKLVLKGGMLHLTLNDGRSASVPCSEHASGHQYRTIRAIAKATKLARKQRVPLRIKPKSRRVRLIRGIK